MKQYINWKIVAFLLGVFLSIEAICMAVAGEVAMIYGEYDCKYLLLSALITFAVAMTAIFLCRGHSKAMGKKEGFLIVTLIWLVFSLFGMLPYLFSGVITNFTDAYFETISGFTTTGSTVFDNIEKLPHGLIFWRCLMQWLGGMGFVVLSMAVLPFINGEMQMFSAEATGPTQDKIQPRIQDTARRLWLLYFSLTGAQTILLLFGGMNIFDAVCHSLATLSTGGYSTKAAGLAAWNSPFLQYVVVIFMLLGGTNFTLLYIAFVKGNLEKFWQNEEFRVYLKIVILATVSVVPLVCFTDGLTSFSQFENNFRNSLFQVVSMVTSTGFVTADYTLWSPMVQLILLALMAVGASAGSTSGGIKLTRMIIFVKNGYYEFKRRIHPRAVLPIRINRTMIPEPVINGIFAFFAMYLTVLFVSVFVLSFCGMSFADAFHATISAISNVGIGFGKLGVSGFCADFPTFAKWWLAFLMLVGRLELFTVLLLFSPSFWKR